MFFSSLESIFSIMLMIALGYILRRKGVFDETTGKVFTTLVSNIALPAYMVWNLTSSFTREKLLSLEDGLVIPFLSMLASFAIGYVISKAIKIAPCRQGTFTCMFFVSNTIFIGLPVNLALFGDQSVPYVLLYYMANTCLFWTIGVYAISRDGSAERPAFLSFQNIQKTFSPPLLGFLVGVLLVLLEIKLPASLLDTCKYLGNLTTPLSMLFIGMSIYGVGLHEIKLNKDMIALIFGRFIISPLTVCFIAMLLPIPLLMKQVFIIQSAMPVITQASIISKAYNADHRYAAVMTAVTTVLAITAIPIYMTLFQHFPGI
ncbi:MAG TPA: AEC family transporter [Patescibacteria group bacterium]|nr:AEC family transporter [Patescibacteria group bacterium]